MRGFQYRVTIAGKIIHPVLIGDEEKEVRLIHASHLLTCGAIGQGYQVLLFADFVRDCRK
jgi:hypothetical protein